jgi:glycerate kinase
MKTMRIAIAPNAFRGSMTARAATDAISDGLRRSALKSLEILPMPLADGGDGTLDVLLGGLGGERLTLQVTGPLGTPVRAEMGLLSDRITAVIEMAQASGVELIPRQERNPLKATSYGTGELIRDGLDRGYRNFVIGLGGSATVDGGAGCLQALGAKLLDSAGNDIPFGGEGLSKLASIDVSELRRVSQGASFKVLCDVTNPLIGPLGAARVFGPQKGADQATVEILEQNLTHFANVIARDLQIDIRTLPGGGAAGGFGAGLSAFLHAEIVPGAAMLISMLGYDKQLGGVDLVITGEGKLDAQTSGGKAVNTIADIARRHNIPVIALAGTLDADDAALQAMGIQAAWSIVPGPCSLDEALKHGPEWLIRAAIQIGNILASSFKGNYP